MKCRIKEHSTFTLKYVQYNSKPIETDSIPTLLLNQLKIRSLRYIRNGLYVQEDDNLFKNI